MDFKDSRPRLSSRMFDELSKSSSVSTETFPSLVESPPFVTFPRPNFMFPLDKYVPDEESSREQLLQHERRSSGPRVPLVSESRTNSTWKWILVFGGLSIGAFLAGLDATIVADAQGPILQSLGEIEKVAWIGVADPLGSGATILLIGSCYGIFQIKYMYMLSMLLFEVGSAICGASTSMNVMIVGRIMVGIGGAGIDLGALNYLSKFTPPRTRPIYNAILGISFGLGNILGPVIGGAFANNPALGWRWSFYINLPLAAIMAPLFLLLLPKHNPMRSISISQKLKLIDIVGFVLHVIVWASFLVGVTMGGSTWSWSSIPSIAVWTLFGVSLFCYVIQQSLCLLTTFSHRIFPVHFLRSRTLVLLFIATAATMTALVIPIFYIPLLYQFAHGSSPMASALNLIPAISAFFIIILCTGALLPRIGYYKAIYILASAFMIVGGIFMSRVNINTPNRKIYLYSILIGIGVGMVFQIAYDIGMSEVTLMGAQDTTATEESGGDEQKLIAYINVAQVGCAGIALSIAGCMYQNLGVKKLQEVFGDGVPVDIIRETLGGLKSEGLGDMETVDGDIMKGVLDAVVATVGNVYWLVIVAGVVCAICGLGMKWERVVLEPKLEGNRRFNVHYEAIA
ncbi:hypothetical protein BCIN_03g00390 [Botrytis cinerea B05.10]|uniref:Major facilitator superfamily (MFS) profile domain-containing protein n=1 Tax=Botryotinia fuckeliana (strain B05.10) TaxID=332648 RepID=A0A384JAV4_BOTFB|nr:hypothetical protein BCIN_03g00390 [Botrytis cinerea B05.10]ATZ47729.1 hypothetical protein BCIN_03g00390 [Botrytis cinerea B05.10]